MEQLAYELVAIDDPPEVKQANPIHGAGAQAKGGVTVPGAPGTPTKG